MMQATIYGRLAFDPRAVTTRSGTPMTSARVAVDVTAKDAQDPQTLWIDLLAFGAQSEALGQLAKGDMVSAIGRLTRGTYTTRGGETREQYTVIADSLISARTCRPKAGGQAAADPGGRARQASMAVQAPAQPDFDDDIPF
jgi:single-strand DNA-binding protein